MRRLFPRPDGSLNTRTHGKTKPADMALFHNAPVYCLYICNKTFRRFIPKHEINNVVNFNTDI